MNDDFLLAWKTSNLWFFIFEQYEYTNINLFQIFFRLVRISAFVSHPALLLFLQTNLKVNEMNYFLRSRTPAGIKSLVQVKYSQEETKKREEPVRRVSYAGSYEYPPVKR